MFSLVKRTLRRAILFATVIKRVQVIEAALVRLEHKVKRFDRLADENEALWDMLDKAEDDPTLDVPDADSAQLQLAEYLVGSVVRGDA